MNILKEPEIIEKVRLQLKAILAAVDGIHVANDQWVSLNEGQPIDSGYDLKLSIEDRRKKAQTLCVEVKSQGHPQAVRNAVSHLKHFAEKHDPSTHRYNIFAAPYLSPEAAKICTDAGIGYLDLSGNCHLAFNGIHIHVEGKPNQYTPKREYPSLFSPKASRVLQILLKGPLRPWKVVDLEKASDVSIGTVSSVRQQLLKQLWAVESEQGLQITKPDAVLDAWVKQDNWKRRTTVREYSLLEHDQNVVARRLHEFFGEREHAFTQWYAAQLRRPFAVTKITTLYVSAFPEESFIQDELLGRRVHGGGSLRLVLPKDAGVFLCKNHLDGLPLVSDVQLYLDLIDAGMRGEEAAQELRNWTEFSGGWNV